MHVIHIYWGVFMLDFFKRVPWTQKNATSIFLICNWFVAAMLLLLFGTDNFIRQANPPGDSQNGPWKQFCGDIMQSGASALPPNTDVEKLQEVCSQFHCMLFTAWSNHGADLPSTFITMLDNKQQSLEPYCDLGGMKSTGFLLYWAVLCGALLGYIFWNSKKREEREEGLLFDCHDDVEAQRPRV